MSVSLKEILKILPENSCILHGWQGLPEHLPSDLDIVVPLEDLPKLETNLLELSGAHLVNLLQHESTCYYFVLAFQEKGRFRFLQVDAAADYRRNGFVWFSAEELLRGRRRWKDFWIASPEVEFKYLLVKKILKGVVPKHAASRLKEFVEELGTQARELVTVLLGSRDGEKVLRWIQTGDWEAFQGHIPKLQKTLKRQRIRQDLLNPLRYWLAEVKRIWQRWRYPTGLFVVVLGPDGAGKSTLINRLEADLSGAFRRTARFHLRPRLFQKTGNDRPVTNPHGQPSRPFFTSLLKLVYYFLDYNLGYWLKVRPALARSTLVLFDRYYDDLLIDPKRYRYGGPMWLARWLCRFIPRPDLWLILDVPEEELLRRKQEVSLEELRCQREGYHRLSVGLSNAVLLDGSLPPEEVARHGEGIILEHLHGRYLSRRNLWFPSLRDEGECEYLNKALGVNPSKKGKAFFRLALLDGRGYLLPFDSCKASAMLSLYSPQRLRAKILKDLLKVGIKTRIFQHFLSKVNLDLHELEEHLAEVFGERTLSLGISLGTPGPHRKPVIQVMNQEGKVLGYVKVGWNEETKRLIQNEIRMLHYLKGRDLPFLIPQIVYAREWKEYFICVQSPPPHYASPAPQEWNHFYEEALKAMAFLSLKYQRLIESAFWKHLSDRISGMENGYFRHAVERFMERVLSRCGDKEIPFHFSHGDFAPWNAFLVSNSLYLYDWEYAFEDAPAGYDLIHFAVQKACLVEGRAPGGVPDAVKWHLGRAQSYRQVIGMDESAWADAFELYLLERLTLGFDKVKGGSFKNHQLLLLALSESVASYYVMEE